MQDRKHTFWGRLRRLSSIVASVTIIGILCGFAARLCTAATGAAEGAMLHQTHINGTALATAESFCGSIVLSLVWLTRPLWVRYAPPAHHRDDGKRSLPQLVQRSVDWLATLPDTLRYSLVLICAALLTMGIKNLAIAAQVNGVSSGSIGATLVIGPLAVSALLQVWEGRPVRAIASSLTAAAGVFLVSVFLAGGTSFTLAGTLCALAAAGLRGLSIPVTRMLIGPGGKGHLGNAAIAWLSTLMNVLVAFLSGADLGVAWQSPQIIVAIIAISLISTVGPSVFDLNCRTRVKDWVYSLVYASGPVLSSLISILALHQPMSVLQLIGIGAICSAVLLSSLQLPRKAKPKTDKLEPIALLVDPLDVYEPPHSGDDSTYQS